MIDKQKLLELIIASFSEKLIESQRDLGMLQESANSETKSSAGDKYETGRAQAQIEIGKLKGIIQVLNEQVAFCHRYLANNNTMNVVSTNSLVYTTEGIFYIMVNYGKLVYENQTIYVISQESPLAKLIWSETIGANFLMPNNKTALITAIY
jgi:hypothetical protein